jgi:hypothetical protein
MNADPQKAALQVWRAYVRKYKPGHHLQEADGMCGLLDGARALVVFIESQMLDDDDPRLSDMQDALHAFVEELRQNYCQHFDLDPDDADDADDAETPPAHSKPTWVK